MAADRHWTALDGLRGVAVLAVLLYHFGAAVGTGGYLGVDVFFVVSGFVVTLSLRRNDARGRSRLEFFLRRGSRLLPNLLALLLAVLVWDSWREHRLLTSQNAAVLEGLTQTYNIFASKGIGTRHLWSLSMEWQFYALLPLALPLLLASGIPAAARRAVIVALASVALRPILIYGAHASYGHIYLWPVTRLDGVMLGVAVAMLFEAGYRLESRTAQVAAAAALTGLLLFAPPWSRAPQFSLFVAMPAASCCTAVLVWAIASGSAVTAMRRVLSAWPATYIGDRSYSIYLWHYFIGVALLAGGEGFAGPRRFVLQIIVSLVVAIAVYETIERPARIYLNGVLATARLTPPLAEARPEPSIS